MEAKTKEEVLEDLRCHPLNRNGGNPTWYKIPIRDFSKEEIILVLNVIYGQTAETIIEKLKVFVEHPQVGGGYFCGDCSKYQVHEKIEAE